ncbi:MAG TPA: hypothetical protein VKM55_24870 [Candidatus Lokiarchaeia archaeon]|nr:hypothetical protein [Candidatus Lokiarchaeia archaeon]
MDIPGPLSSWYHVRFDDDGITRDVHPSDQEPWTDFVPWDKIIRICFQTAEEFFESDELYIFTSERDESYLIPMDADGALDLRNKILDKGLFDAKLAIKLASSSGKIACWPPSKDI